MTEPTPLEKAFGLSGKHALVTGGGGGLGLAIAKALAAAGARVTVAGRRADVLEAAKAEIGGDVASRTMDLSDLASLKDAAADIEASRGAVDILVNNAGNTVKKPFEEQTAEDFDRVFDVHVRGALELTRCIVPGQAARGGGSVIFLASMTSFIGQPFVMGYTTAKSALLGAVRGLSAEYASRGVRVNGIAPGWIDTALFRAATSNDAARLNKILGRIQMGRVGQPEDIGWAAVFLASPAAGYVTGQTLVVDGGALVGF
ncbi:SDR family NAD(P)-dependent oxidoreductase [Ollibium composti]|uniref:SDR family oxidoreductase n=1 Tax=Ollibium composti TaxID=2675109 RepID=A0ABY2Q1W4_9HYPH|nr:SDR family oxidoreductase [Mesorhizobium composti]THF54842.1 SDR family oxidoreductase [Mesorhizobium composti]